MEKTGSLSRRHRALALCAAENFPIQAIETPLLWLFIASLGALSVAALAPAGGAEIMQALVQEAASGDNPIAAAAFALLLVAVVAIALSTMASGFPAGLCRLRYDILPAKEETSSGNIAGRLFFLAIVLALIVTAEMLPIGFTGGSFLALVFALGGPVLSFAPLIVSGIFSHRRPGPVWALFILGSGVICLAGGLIGFIATGNDALWGASPPRHGTSCCRVAKSRYPDAIGEAVAARDGAADFDTCRG